jgi:hypothetical protein
MLPSKHPGDCWHWQTQPCHKVSSIFNVDAHGSFLG